MLHISVYNGKKDTLFTSNEIHVIFIKDTQTVLNPLVIDKLKTDFNRFFKSV